MAQEGGSSRTRPCPTHPRPWRPALLLSACRPHLPPRAVSLSQPRSSYLYYCQDSLEAMKAQHPDLSVTELARLQGAQWKELDESQKAPFIEKAAKDVERYKTEMEEGGFFELERQAKEAKEKEKADALAAHIAAGGEPPPKVMTRRRRAHTRTRGGGGPGARARAPGRGLGSK